MKEIEIVNVEPQVVITIRKRGYYRDVAGMISDLILYARQQGVEIVGASMFLFHEKGLDEARQADAFGTADLEVALPVAEKVKSEKFECYELAGGKMARLIHKGRYVEIVKSYYKLFQWA
ncbi:GyrI-like domain-containing protein, partial [Nanoarchaeota archaeon]